MSNVQVKPLEWDLAGNDDWIALGAGAEYLVELSHNESWYYEDSGPFPDADAAKVAAQADYEARIRSALVPAPAVPDVKPLAEFGHGKWVVDTGTHYGKPAVFIGPSPEPGPVGEKTKPEHQLPQGCLKEDEFFLTFPTDEQAKRVADALVNAAPAVPDDVAGLIAELRKTYSLVAVWPENNPDGFMNLLALRNLTPAAADALEAQAAELARLKAKNDTNAEVADIWARKLDTAEDENRNLRAALERCLNFIDNTECELGMTLECGDIARAALTHPTGD